MTDTRSDRPLVVLLVEDNAGDIRWTREILKEVRIPTILAVAHDGVDAMETLLGLGSGRPQQPDIILLDLQLPRKDGLELLAEMAADEDLWRIPVAILATSENNRDVDRCFELGAVSYIAKPVDADRLALVLAMITKGAVEPSNAGPCRYQLSQETVLEVLFKRLG